MVGKVQEQVERVAKAMYDATHAGLRNCYAWEDAWEDHQEHHRDRYYKEARAAIAAMIPTPTQDTRDRVKVLEEALAWQTIESAPKDGTRFLGWDEELGVRTMWWDAHFESDGWDDAKDAPKYREAWNAGRVQSWGYEEYHEEHPTYWLPSLPGPALGNKETDHG